MEDEGEKCEPKSTLAKTPQNLSKHTQQSETHTYILDHLIKYAPQTGKESTRKSKLKTYDDTI